MINGMLSQVNLPAPSGSELLVWLAGLGLLLMLLDRVLRIKRSIFPRKDDVEIHPRPLEIRKAVDYVTKEHCDAIHSGTASHIRELKVSVSDILSRLEKGRADGDYMRKAIYSEIKEREQATRQHIESVRHELSEKIDAMPDRLVAMLRNFGVIGRE